MSDERSEPQFVAMLRIRNEARWIAEVIESVAPLCDRVFVMDDHSTDNTAEICARYPMVEVFPSPFQGLNEARDKNWLYDRILERCRPEWILCVDGDEVLEAGGGEQLRAICAAGDADAYRLKIAFLWNDPQTVRVDRIYDFFYRPSLFKPFYPRPDVPDDQKLVAEFRWMATPFGRVTNGNSPNLHCSSVPQRRIHGAPNIPVVLKHYGYLHRADRVRKLDYYTSVDWLNKAEDCYRHMTQGDNVTLEELPLTQQLVNQGRLTMADVRYMVDTPVDAYLVHAGPLQLRAMECVQVA